MNIEKKTRTITEEQKSGILRLLTQELERRSEIIFAYVFGSFVEGTSFRDIDVAIYLSELHAAHDTLSYAIGISTDMERVVGHPVDVIVLNAAPDHLVHWVSKGTVIVNRDSDFRTDFVARAWSRYLDFKPKRRQAMADLFRRRTALAE
jgi:predicted nucleotidyltransferase